MTRWWWGAALALTGCAGPDDEGPPDRPDDVCPETGTIATDRDLIVNLWGSGRSVLWIERASPSSPTELWQVQLDGAEASPPERLRVSRSSEVIVSAAIAGEAVVYLQRPSLAAPSQLYLLGGADPEPVSVRTYTGTERIVGATDTHVWVAHEDGGVAIDRLDLATGEVVRTGGVERARRPTHLRLAGDDLYFRTQRSGAAEGARIYRLGASAEARAATALGEVGTSGDCGFPLGGLAVTADELVCGFEGVFAFDRDTGDSRRQVAPAEEGRNQVVVGASGGSAYVIDLHDGVNDVPLEALDLETGARRNVACDAREVIPGTLDSSVTDQTAYQLAVTDDAVVWVEEQRQAAGAFPVVAVRIAPR